MSLESFVKQVDAYEAKLKAARERGATIITEEDRPDRILHSMLQFIASNRDELLIVLAKRALTLERELQSHLKVDQTARERV